MSELGEPGESLRNLAGRYPRSLFRVANAKGDPGRCSLIVKCKIDICLVFHVLNSPWLALCRFARPEMTVINTLNG